MCSETLPRDKLKLKSNNCFTDGIEFTPAEKNPFFNAMYRVKQFYR